MGEKQLGLKQVIHVWYLLPLFASWSLESKPGDFQQNSQTQPTQPAKKFINTPLLLVFDCQVICYTSTHCWSIIHSWTPECHNELLDYRIFYT